MDDKFAFKVTRAGGQYPITVGQLIGKLVELVELGLPTDASIVVEDSEHIYFDYDEKMQTAHINGYICPDEHPEEFYPELKR